MKRRIVSSVVVGILVFGVVTGGARAATIDTQLADWIMSTRRSSGAFVLRPFDARINPYFNAFAAIGLARIHEATGNAAYANAAWSWLHWHRTHMEPDGTIYNWLASGPTTETKTTGRDSTDSYAAMFLVALRETYAATGDTQQLQGFAHAISMAVKGIELTRDPTDGLTWALPTYPIKYLMDQSEVYAGLRAAEELAPLAPDPTDPLLESRARTEADVVVTGVEGYWDPSTRTYRWAKDGVGAYTAASWTYLYPDAVAQLWPYAVGDWLRFDPLRPLVPLDRAVELTGAFLLHEPSWDRPSSIRASRDPCGYGPCHTGFWPVAGWSMIGTAFPANAVLGAQHMRAEAFTETLEPLHVATAGELIVLELET